VRAPETRAGGPGDAVERRRSGGGGPRAAALAIAAAALLAGPTILAFSRGGFFDEARLRAAIAAWVLVAVTAVLAPRPLPRSGPAIAALAGLAGLLGWTLLSLGWTPLHGAALDDAERLALYLAALLAATALLRGRAATLAVPALAAGTVVVIAYGLSEWLLPGVFELTRSRAALGRIDEPLTYWNAMGALAAMGLVLSGRLAGEAGRHPAMRTLAAAAAAPLGAGIGLSLSRGAIAAAVLGLGALALLDARGPALVGAAVAAVAALVAGATAVALPAVRTLEGARESEGLVLTAVLVAVMVGAALVTRRVAVGADDRGGAEPVRLRAAGRAVAIVVVAGLVLTAGAAALEGAPEATSPRPGATATRLSSADSNRYSYWKVAMEAFGHHPLRGHGSGSFAVDWLRERDVPDVVRDAHSLELETAAELGIVGLALLALMLGGVVAGAVVALRRTPAAAIGPVAALTVWAAHSALDWDWEMPALTLVAVLLAGMLLAATDE
jgi:O-Antigen ligase